MSVLVLRLALIMATNHKRLDWGRGIDYSRAPCNPFMTSHPDGGNLVRQGLRRRQRWTYLPHRVLDSRTQKGIAWADSS